MYALPVSQIQEFPVAVVNKLNKVVLGVLTSSPVVQNDFQQVAHTRLMVNLNIKLNSAKNFNKQGMSATYSKIRSEGGDLRKLHLYQRINLLLPGLSG